MIHKALPKSVVEKLTASRIKKSCPSPGRPNTPTVYMAPVKSVQLAPMKDNPLKCKLEKQFNIREVITLDDREYRYARYQ